MKLPGFVKLKYADTKGIIIWYMEFHKIYSSYGILGSKSYKMVL